MGVLFPSPFCKSYNLIVGPSQDSEEFPTSTFPSPAWRNGDAMSQQNFSTASNARALLFFLVGCFEPWDMWRSRRVKEHFAVNLACSLSLSFSFSCSRRSRSRSRSSGCIETLDNQMALVLFHQSNIFQNVCHRSSFRLGTTLQILGLDSFTFTFLLSLCLNHRAMIRCSWHSRSLRFQHVQLGAGCECLQLAASGWERMQTWETRRNTWFSWETVLRNLEPQHFLVCKLCASKKLTTVMPTSQALRLCQSNISLCTAATITAAVPTWNELRLSQHIAREELLLRADLNLLREKKHPWYFVYTCLQFPHVKNI